MALLLPGFEVTPVLVPFAIVAVAMVVVTVVVLGLVLARERRPPLLTQMLLSVGVVGGGSVLLLALVVALVNPDQTSAWTWVLLAFNFMMAVPVGLWFITLVIYRDRRVAPEDWLWPAALATATTGAEVLMGVLFAIGEASGPLSTVASFAHGLSSVWYFWSMAAVMAALVRWARLRPSGRAVALGLLATAVVAPWVAAYPLVGGIAIAAVMGAVVAFLLRALVGGKVGPDEGRFLLAASAAFLSMTLAGLGLVASGGADVGRLAFGAVMGVVMTAEVAVLVRGCYAVLPESGARALSVGTTVPSEPALSEPAGNRPAAQFVR